MGNGSLARSAVENICDSIIALELYYERDIDWELVQERGRLPTISRRARMGGVTIGLDGLRPDWKCK